MSEQPSVCEWSIDAEGTWVGPCGIAWQFTDGGPTENAIKFCPHCGKPVKALPAKFDEWGNPIVGCDCDLLEKPDSPPPCETFRLRESVTGFCATCGHLEECHF